MSDKQYDLLFRNIKKLHAAARGYLIPVNGAIRIPVGAGVTPRIFSRSAVSALEAHWFQQARGENA